MWKISKMLAITLAIVIGGTIGYINNNSQSLNANPVTMIRWVDVPKTDVSLPKTISIDLQKDQVSISGNTENATVNVQREIKEVPVYIEKKVREIVYKPDLINNHKLLKHIAPSPSDNVTKRSYIDFLYYS